LTTSILNKRKAKSLLTVESIGHFTPETTGCIKLARFGVHDERISLLEQAFRGRQTFAGLSNCVDNLTDKSDELYPLCLTGY